MEERSKGCVTVSIGYNCFNDGIDAVTNSERDKITDEQARPSTKRKNVDGKTAWLPALCAFHGPYIAIYIIIDYSQ
jgi:hypothetical protein